MALHRIVLGRYAEHFCFLFYVSTAYTFSTFKLRKRGSDGGILFRTLGNIYDEVFWKNV